MGTPFLGSACLGRDDLIRYADNGITAFEFTGDLPEGCWEITPERYHDRIAEALRVMDAMVEESRQRTDHIKRSARHKLMSGLPLTEEEAAVVVP